MKSVIERIVAWLCCVCNLMTVAVFYPKPQMTESVRFAQALKQGWNLGNTLEAWQIPEPADTETCWGNPKASKELFQLVKDLGFTSIRIPVTWFQHMDAQHSIEPEWMDRVQEVVDAAMESGLYTILNVQHDDQDWLIADRAHEANASGILDKVWTQIATRFKAYDEKLIFDVMNEPRVVGAPDEWVGNEEQRAVVNHFNEIALQAIRRTGGKNTARYVMITTCCASVEAENCDALSVPNDEHVIVSLHYYYRTAHRSEFEDCKQPLWLSDIKEIHKTLRRISETYLQKGIGVCISEFGWTDRAHLWNLSHKARLFVRLVTNYGMSCLVWDNGADFRLIDRQNLTAAFPSYIHAITQNPFIDSQTQKRHSKKSAFFGAGDRARTGTVLLPRDFKSLASANSATPATLQKLYALRPVLSRAFSQNATQRRQGLK